MTLTLAELNQRSVDVFKELVDAYMETGGPVGSHTISRRLKEEAITSLSPATIRNIMADLEEMGLLYAPHVSAGRIPTVEGLRFFVNGLLQIGDIALSERTVLEEQCHLDGKNIEMMLEGATGILSGLCKCVGIVVTPKVDSSVKQVEFVRLSDKKALVVIISEDGIVENRLMDLCENIAPSVLEDAAKYINRHLQRSKNLTVVKESIIEELRTQKAYLDELTSKVVQNGLAVWSGQDQDADLIVRGQSHLLQGLTEVEDIEQIHRLLGMLEKKKTVSGLLDNIIQADGVHIFIGAENNLFNISGCSVIASTFHNAKHKIIGALGIIGPSRMQYGRIIPLVDYTAKLITRLLSS
jgi:heat-inducible transcriptional repressor